MAATTKRKSPAWESAKHYRKSFYFGPFFKMFEAVFELILPIFIGLIISQGIAYDADGQPVGANWSVIGLYASLILAMIIFGFCSTMICQYLASVASQGSGTDLRNRLYKHVQNLSAAEVEKYGVSNILNIVTYDTTQCQQGIAMLIRMAIRAPFLMIGALVASLIVDWQMGLIFLALAVFLFIFLGLFLPHAAGGYARVQKQLDTMTQKANDSLSGSRVVRAFAKEEREIHIFTKASGKYKDKYMRVVTLTSAMAPLTSFAVNLVTICVVLLAGLTAGFDHSTTAADIAQANGRIVTLVNYLNQILQAVLVTTNLIIIFTRAYASQKRIDELLRTKPSVNDRAKYGHIKLKNGASIFKLSQVTFNYPDSAIPTLSNINLDIKKGQKIGIIGETGSGKSTLINLLLRFFDKSRGKVSYKGHDIRHYELQNLYAEVGYVPQKPAVFRGSIQANLTYANPQADQGEMKKALKLALCDFALKDENGLQRLIEEGAKDLSGGQRQRLAIAMALVRHPEVLIMDDAFSALDFISEKNLRDNLASLGAELTQIVVSERISSLSGCDQIIVMNKGQIEASGTFDQLLETSPIFKGFWDIQKGEAR